MGLQEAPGSDRAAEGEATAGERLVPRERRFRLVPPAITPITFQDLGAGLLGHLRGQGREGFSDEIESFLDAEMSGTYTSFRRALAGCLHELADSTSADRTSVLIPAFCSSDFPDTIKGVGLEPVRYDIDSETLSLDMDSLEDAFTDDALAVVAINVLGYGSPMRELAARCADWDVFLVEALGYGLGTRYEDERLGTFGDCTVLNFQQGKPIPVGGGMVLSQDSTLEFHDEGRPAVGPNIASLTGYAMLSRPRAYYAYSRLRDHLADMDLLTDRMTTHPESKFDVEYARPFATMSDFQGAIARRVFHRLEAHGRVRRRTARFYENELADCPNVRVLQPVEGLSKVQFVRFPLLAESEALRDRIRDVLVDEGIQASTLYDWPVIDPDIFPGASSLQRGIVTLPTHPYVDDRDRRRIVETVRRVVDSSESV